jgi:hypothetical protein
MHGLIMKLMSRIFVLMGITLLMVGSKLVVMFLEGLSGQSTSSGSCVAGTIYIVDVTDPNPHLPTVHSVLDSHQAAASSGAQGT